MFTAILLAAGQSTRMKKLKALLQWQNMPLINSQIINLQQSGADSILVVIGHEQEKIKTTMKNNPNVVIIKNPDYLKGKSTSILAGLKKVKTTMPLLILSVDQPRSTQVIKYLIKNHLNQKLPITIPTYLGKKGHPVIFSGSILKELKNINENTKGLKAITQKDTTRNNLVPITNPEILIDINTPKDYQKQLIEQKDNN